MTWVTKANIDSKKPLIKALCKEYGVKATLSGTNDYSMKLTIASGEIDFIENYCKNIQKNKFYMNDIEHVIDRVRNDKHIGVTHYYMEDSFDGKALEFLQKAYQIMNMGNHDNSDIQTDYFDVGFYIDIQVGRWNKPYELKLK